MPQHELRRAQVSRLTVSGLLTVCFVLMLLTGCVISPRRTVGGSTSPTPTPTATPTPTPGVTGQLYVSNDTANALLRFSNALTVNGSTATPTVIKGTATKLNGPQYLFLDVANDTLYVANSGSSSILVFANASTMTGSPAPTREIASIALTSPSDVALDKTRNLLYVADGFEIFSFANASTATGTLSAAQDIVLTFAPSALFVDAANNRLYAADATGSQIAIFDAASTLNGPKTPTRTISGAATQLNAPSGVLLDSNGRLVVSNGGVTGPSITIYSSASVAAGGNATPVAVLNGVNTTFNTPNQIVLNTAATGGDLYVTDPAAGAVDIFTNLAAANGSPAPARRLTGTGVTQSTVAPTARGIALDITR
jgi:hypothetical protein